MTEQTATETAAVAAGAYDPGPAAATAGAHDAAPGGRPRLLAALRWTAAVLVFAAAGAGTAYGITRPERTDLPGLSTRGDGRWDYPALSRPALPAGAPLPFAKDNQDGIHYAALSQLLLPAPRGSSPDPGLKLGTDSAVTPDTFLEEYEPTVRERMKQGFTDDGLRQIAGRGWTTPDGTRTRVYLLRFHSSGFVDSFQGCTIGMNVNGVNRMEQDTSWTKVKYVESPPEHHGIAVYEEAEPVGDEQVKAGCVSSGDIQAVIFQTRKGRVASVPLHQTAVLQSLLLG